MNNELLTLVIGLALAAVLGFFTARSSQRREPIYGGILAKAFHYIGAGLFVAIAPTVLISALVLKTGHMIIPLILGFAASSYVALFIHAIFERPAYEEALRRREERGWTAEDAQTSGL
ncbi:MAG: hypothetical protein D6712_01050 [Chloroflexi bacterium]|nr:MAG: hypothetical protein D6712_01050 [Chloroflexota bacterium]